MVSWKDCDIDMADPDGCRELLHELMQFDDKRHPSWFIEYAAEGVAEQLREAELDALRHAGFGRPERADAARDRVTRLRRLLRILGCLLAIARAQLVNASVDDFVTAMGWRKGGKVARAGDQTNKSSGN